MDEKTPEEGIPDVDLGDIAKSKYENFPSKEDSELLRRLLQGAYGREDLRDMGEGAYLGPNYYDGQGRYIGQQPKQHSQDEPPEEMPF